MCVSFYSIMFHQNIILITVLFVSNTFIYIIYLIYIIIFHKVTVAFERASLFVNDAYCDLKNKRLLRMLLAINSFPTV